MSRARARHLNERVGTICICDSNMSGSLRCVVQSSSIEICCQTAATTASLRQMLLQSPAAYPAYSEGLGDSRGDRALLLMRLG